MSDGPTEVLPPCLGERFRLPVWRSAGARGRELLEALLINYDAYLQVRAQGTPDDNLAYLHVALERFDADSRFFSGAVEAGRLRFHRVQTSRSTNRLEQMVSGRDAREFLERAVKERGRMLSRDFLLTTKQLHEHFGFKVEVFRAGLRSGRLPSVVFKSRAIRLPSGITLVEVEDAERFLLSHIASCADPSVEARKQALKDASQRRSRGNAHSRPRAPRRRFTSEAAEWWTPALDRAIQEEISYAGWAWHHDARETLLRVAPEAINAWLNSLVGLSESRRHTALVDEALAHAAEAGWTEGIRRPERQMCRLCGKRYHESSLTAWQISRVGVEGVRCCAPCFVRCLMRTAPTADRQTLEEITAAVARLAAAIGAVPTQRFGEAVRDFRRFAPEQQEQVLRALASVPNMDVVRHHFGSWFAVLVASGVLENAQRTTRGTRSLAADGHVCLSLAERTIDDFLFAEAIPHEKEPPYPEGGYRADFMVSGLFIEYFGLAGDPQYDERAAKKRELCKTHGIQLLAITPADLAGDTWRTQLRQASLRAMQNAGVRGGFHGTE